jgi:coenzyme F420-reducing hydrogenase delta subunit
MKNQTFKTLVDGTEKEVMVRTPSLTDQREAQKVYNQAFTDAIKSKAVVRAKMEDVLTDQGLWDKEKQAKLSELQSELLDHERKLAIGGISLKEAKRIAMAMKELREDIRDLISVRTSLDNHSAEGQADNAKFNYLVSVCVVYNDNKEPVFKNMEDYLNRATENMAIVGAQNLANMIYGLDSNYENNLPENKFLKKYKFVDDKLRLIDNKGRLVDEEGRLINETGRFIDESGKFVDKFGNPVDEEGNYVVEFKPFLDDDGNPVSEEETVAAVSDPVVPAVETTTE